MSGNPVVVHIPSRDVSAVIACVAAGSRYESPGTNGLAHLLEHGVFLGAGSRDYRTIRATIDRLGGDVSAETSEELIVYWGSVNEARDFEECVDLVAELVLAPWLQEEALQREIGTVIQEISGAGDDIFQVVLEATKRLLWPDNVLGMPVGGVQSALRRLDARICRDYWQSTHRGERILVVVVGSAAESKVVRRRFDGRPFDGSLHLQSFKGWSRPASARRSTARLQASRFRALPMAGNFSRLCFGLPGISWSDPRLPAVSLLNDVLGRDETSHLWERIRGQGLAYSTESFVDCFSDAGWIGVLTDAPPDATGDVVRIVLEEVASLSARLTEEEFEQARQSHIARLRNDEQTAPLEWAKYQAVHTFFRGRVPSVEDLVRDVQAVTLAQTRQAAEELLLPERLKLAVGGPRRALRQAESAFSGN